MPPPSRKAKKKTHKPGKGPPSSCSSNRNNNAERTTTTSSSEGTQNVETLVEEENKRQCRSASFPSVVGNLVSKIPLPLVTFLLGIFVSSSYYNYKNSNVNGNNNQVHFIQLQSRNKIGGTHIHTTNSSSSSSIISNNDTTATTAATTAATTTSSPLMLNPAPAPSPSCSLYVAKSTIHNSGLGIYTTKHIPRGHLIPPSSSSSSSSSSDIVIQFPDPNPHHSKHIRVLSYDYFWNGQEMGGQYEGTAVYSVVPGVGMLANGHDRNFNAKLYSPPRHRKKSGGSGGGGEGSRIDNAGLFRYVNPGAGAISHYWNYSFYASRDIPPNGEIFVNYGSDWFNERKNKKLLGDSNDDDDRDRDTYRGGSNDFINDIDISHEQEKEKVTQNNNITRPPGWIEENGLCIDNLKVGQSTNKEAGRGAFATRFIKKHQIVSPAPLVQITDRSALKMIKVKMGVDSEESLEETDQLLLNYCFGHPDSSILLFPIAPVVNFINHDSAKYNVKLRWSNSTQHEIQNPHDMFIQDVKDMNHAGLMLEFFATRDIQEGDEIFLDYGPIWEAAWKSHVSKWQHMHQRQHSDSKSNDDSHTYASLFDEQTEVIRTHSEQQVEPYPDNLFISCYYNYDNKKYSYQKKVYRWEMTNTVFLHSNLRPCIVLDRHETSNDHHDKFGEEDVYTYTVAIQNRYGLSEDQRIPQGSKHIVNNVPRRALTFSGKIYFSDQHYAEAFRHEINLPDDIFPTKWMDLKRTSK